MISVNKYHTHLCGEISEKEIGKEVRVAGWVENIRDHGGVQFIDLRDHYGVVQIVIHNQDMLKTISRECTLTVKGKVVLRDADTVNPKIPTGTVEIRVEELTVLGEVTAPLPFEVSTSRETKEDVRLKYRYLDLRNPKVHQNIVLRSQLISYLRQKMTELGFLEIQTPIPFRVVPGRRARLPHSEPQASRQILRAAAGAAAL
jgi:aspartyl-tRNA synthetase